MDFVYLNRDGDNEELRYSIRSVHHFYPEANIWVVGGKPDWYVGNFIRVERDNRLNRYQQQVLNLSYVYNSNKIGPNPIIMNDDFFFVERVEEFVPLIGGTISEKIDQYLQNGYNNSNYVKELNKMKKILQKIKQDPLDYELHVPMQVRLDKLKEVVEFNKIMWRSHYGNKFINDKDAIKTKDVKLYIESEMSFKNYNPVNGNSPFFSTDDKSFRYAKEKILNKLFSSPSPYELDQD
jgi:hypothetical protein